jgi:hypothetical protein
VLNAEGRVDAAATARLRRVRRVDLGADRSTG